MLARQLAEASDYDGLVAAIRMRVEELQISRETINEVAGLPAGYSGKILGLKQRRRLGMISLGPILGALGIKLVVVEDEQALKLVRGRFKKRNENLVRCPRKAGPDA
jgi:hypothetical protein